MTTTMTDDLDGWEFLPMLEFWGGPLDGIRLQIPEETELPNNKLQLFRHPYGVVHDPDNGGTVYYFCPLHQRMEVCPPSKLPAIVPLDPGEEE